MNRPPHVEKILAALGRLRNRYTSEATLQQAVLMAFDHAAVAYVREHPLTKKERIDFHVPGPPPVGLEVKCKGGEMEHLRQLYRYAPHYEDLILVTTQASRPDDQLLVTNIWENPADEKTCRGHVCRLHVVNISLRL
jgi:hypothetical protein